MKSISHVLLWVLAVLFAGAIPTEAFAQASLLQEGHTYTIKNVDAQKYLSLQSNYNETNVVNATPLTASSTQFTIRSKAGKYYLKSGSNYVTFSTMGNYARWNTGCTSQPAYLWEIEAAAGGGQFYIKSEKGFLKFDGSNPYAYTSGQQNESTLWQFVDVTQGVVSPVDYTEVYDLTTYEHLSALYPSADVAAARTSLGAALNDGQARAAVESLRAKANGRAVVFSSVGRSSAQNPHYIYRRPQELVTSRGNSFFGTGSYADAASSAVFIVEYVAGSGYKFRSAVSGEYLGKTQADNILLREATAAEAGVYDFEWSGADNFGIKCLNPLGSHAYLHEEGQGTYVVAWNSGNAPSCWTVTAAESVTIRAVDAAGNSLLPDAQSYFFGSNVSIPAPAIDGYVARKTSQPAVGGGVVTFVYDLKSYTVSYKYYLLDPKEDAPHYQKSYTGLHYGDDLPAPDHTHLGLKLIKVPTGQVTCDGEYRIYCIADDYVPEPDPVLPKSVNITYRYLYGDREVKLGAKRNVANGTSMPELDALPAFVRCNAPSGKVNYYGDTVIDLQVTFDLPFKSYGSYEEITEWCNVSIANAHLLFNYNASDTYMHLTDTGVKKEDKYLFAFVGDPFQGYMIYNKAAGKGKVLSAPAPRPSISEGGEDYVLLRSTPVAKGYNDRWDLYPSTSNSDGFYIARRGETMYINNRQTKLAFWTRSQDHGSSVYISPVDLSLGTSTTMNSIPAGAVPATGKVYRIYSAYSDIKGHMVSEQKPVGDEVATNGKMYLTNQKTVRDLSQMWMAICQNAETHKFQLVNLASGRFMQVGGSTAESTTDVFILPTQVAGKYGICSNADGTGRNALNTNINKPVTNWSWESNGTGTPGSNWVFVEVEYGVGGEFTQQELKDRVRSFSSYAFLESGKYYRLKSDMYPTLYMAENFMGDRKVRAMAEDALPNPYAAVWKLEGTKSDGFTFTNALTSRVIATQTGWDTQYPTADAGAKSFFVVEDGGSDFIAPRYTFCPNDPQGNSNPAWSLHCQAGGKVLNWNYRNADGSFADASFWHLEAVEVPSEAELAQMYQNILDANATVNALLADRDALNAKLALYFEDSACSRLHPQYRNVSDAVLRALLDEDGIPTVIQDVVIRVKNGKWEADKDRTYNNYVRDFRIADYAPFSDRNAWNTKLKISATCYLTSPTGITVKAGDVVYLFVDEEAKAGAQFNLDVVEDTDAGAAANLGSLHKGLNVFTASATGELFINYKVADTEKYLERAKDLSGQWHEPDYLPIKVHIEGGTANGYWDLSRGMTETDWQWLCNNMFPSKFLHIKGRNSLLCILTKNGRYADNITGCMQIYDYIYTQELKYIGHDGQFDGRYKPSVTVRDGYSGLNWNGSSANLAGHGPNYESMITAGYWGICHEIGHGIQGVFNLAGLTEVTNNALVQMINHDFGVKSSRGISVEALLEYKNNADTWIDVLRSNNVTWATNHLFFQLYLYFEHAGHMPGFMGRVCDKIRDWGGIQQHTQNKVIRYDEDYLMYAKACAEVSQTDLSDFFDAWGFFGYSEDNHSSHAQDEKSNHIYYIGDYGSVSLRQPSRNNPEDVAYVEGLKAYMKGLPHKAPNLLFINDRLQHDGWVVSDTCAAAKIDPRVIGQPVGYIDGPEHGDFGMFYDFGASQHGSNINLQLDEARRTITVSGEGIVGIKICDANGANRYLYNTRTINLSNEVVQKIASGELKVVVALGDNTELPILRQFDDLNGDGHVTIADLAILVDYANRCRNYTSAQIQTLRQKILNM